MALFGGSAPKPKEIPVPSRTSTEVQQAAEAQRAAIASENDSATNWLTGGMGVNEKKLRTGAATLLGG